MIHTFLFVAQAEGVPAGPMLRAAAEAIRTTLPRVGGDLRAKVVLLPERRCSWVVLAAPGIGGSGGVDHAIEGFRAVLAFGGLDGDGGGELAHTILERWEAGGPGAVRVLEGCFAAVLIDGKSRAVTLLSDSLGQRTPRYQADTQRLVVSPHDVCLVALSVVPDEIDSVSAASVAAIGWSLGGQSLLKTVRTCHPAGYVEWSGEEVRLVSDPIIDEARRIDRGDAEAINGTVDLMIETARSAVREVARCHERTGPCMLELTAGLDSRAVLGLLLSTVGASGISATTVGEEGDLDVRVARRLAAHYGISWHGDDLTTHDTRPSAGDFDRHARIVAFATNGDANAKILAIQPVPRHEPDIALTFCGEGGEIFRGYYGHEGGGPQATLTSDEASRLVRGFVDGRSRSALRGRLRQCAVGAHHPGPRVPERDVVGR